MPRGVFTKDPNAVLDYSFNWATWLVSDTISTSTWTADTGITINSTTNTTTLATVWLSGGAAGTTYIVTNRIVTNGGRTEDRSLTINVEQR